MNPRAAVAACFALACWLVPSVVLADPPEGFDGPVTVHEELSHDMRRQVRAKEAATWRKIAGGPLIADCYPTTAQQLAEPIAEHAELLTNTQREIEALRIKADPSAQTERATKAAAVTAARDRLATLDAARRAAAERQRSADVDAASPAATEAARQRAAETKAANEAAQAAWVDARDELTSLSAELKAIEDRVQAEEERTRKLADAERNFDQKDHTLDGLTSSLSATQSPEEFEKLVTDSKRRAACKAAHEALLASTSPGSKSSIASFAASEADRAHHVDILRKGPTVASALEGGAPIVETAGAPDRLAFAIMSGLGAESRTDGTRVVTTLNLAGLVEPDERKWLALPAPARHLFVQANLPVSSTEDVSSVGPADASTDDVVRFSLKIGTSLTDDTDTRLPDHETCYRLAWMAVPSSATVEGEDARVGERARLFDVCNRIAAQQQRVALRAGLGLITEDGDTRTERIAAAVIYAPTSFFYVNGMYQRLLEPNVRDVFGGGFSLSVNVGGPGTSGVDAWARAGLDVLALGVRSEPSDDIDVEFRIAPTVRAKVLEQGIMTLAVGPRLVGSRLDDDDAEILATVGLTWDADELVDSLLDPASVATK